jgi:hypothetical protein
MQYYEASRLVNKSRVMHYEKENDGFRVMSLRPISWGRHGEYVKNSLLPSEGPAYLRLVVYVDTRGFIREVGAMG